jgi:mono/diheme cytochrome c family protein
MRFNPFIASSILVFALANQAFGQVHLADHQQQDLRPATVFEIPGVKGQPIVLPGQPPDDLTVLCFLGVECPLARLYAPRLRRLQQELDGRGVRFIGINSNQQDSMDELSTFVDEFQITFECGKDYDNRIADRFDVKRTPEVIVLDDQLQIQYRGRIDDQYAPGVARSQPQRNDLQVALDELMNGEKVTVAQTEPEGCLLGRVKHPTGAAKFTYARDIAPILQEHCVECHRSGEIGPFEMDQYEEVVGWADMIVEVIDNGRMPPWHADPKHGRFLNERRIPEISKQTIRQWVADGAPFGSRADLPSSRTFVSGWRLPREPDQIVEMRDRPFVVPAEGTVEYQYFVVDPGLKEDKWISAAEVVPGNRQVVHHSIVFVRPPDGRPVSGAGWLAAYVPGQKGLEFRSDRARFVPAGSKLVFQQHYTTNGSQQEDITKVGLIFANEAEIKEQLITLIAIDQQFEIQPHTSNYVVEMAGPRFPKRGKLLALSPHMHFRGKSFSARMTRHGTVDTLLNVPAYDFNWQHIYQLAEPIDLEELEGLEVEVTFDNSADNPFNPDPDRFVTWGDQTWEEMAVAFFDVAIQRNAAGENAPATPKATNLPLDPATEKRVSKFVDDFFTRFDLNRDGVVVKTELPLSTANWAYRKYNSDGQSGLTRDEIRQQAVKRFGQKPTR